jgi:hypothetical protein
MSLSDLASLGSFVSGIAVLISLIYLALQVRQAERNQQTSIRHSRVSRSVEFQLTTADPGVVDAWQGGLLGAGAKEMTESQQSQFLALCRGLFFHLEDSFYQHEEGLLNEEAFETMLASARVFAGNPGARAAWKTLRRNFAGRFAKFMDDIVAQATRNPTRPALDEWKAACAAETSR